MEPKQSTDALYPLHELLFLPVKGEARILNVLGFLKQFLSRILVTGMNREEFAKVQTTVDDIAMDGAVSVIDSEGI